MNKLSFYYSSVLGISLSCGLAASENQALNVYEMSLSKLIKIKVEVATKTKETTDQIPAIITVITSQDIHQYGYESVAEVMSHVTGFIDNYDLALHNFGVRGVNSGVRSGTRTVKFMIDGNPTAFRSTSQNFVGQELIPMSMIERIEIVRGPVSALYGANAFLGVVNIVTKQAKQLQEQGISVTLKGRKLNDAGSGYLGSLIGGKKNEHFQISGSVSVSKIDRQGIELPRRSPDYRSFDNTTSTVPDDYETFNFYSKADYQLNTSSDIEIAAYFQRMNVDNTFTDLNALRDEGPNKTGYDNYFLKLGYQKRLSEKINFKAYSVISGGDTTDDDKVELGAESFFLTRRIGYSSLDLDAEVLIDLSNTQSLLLGLEIRQDDQDLETFSRVERSSGDSTALSDNKDKVIRNKALFAQYLFRFHENWRGVLGYRFDDDSIIEHHESFRLGLVGQLPWNLTLKVLAGSSFQTPSPELLFRESAQSGDIIGNEDLRAQKAKTTEISLSAPISDFLHLTATLYKTDVEDLVTFNSNTFNLFAENSTNSETEGFEFEARFKWHNFNGYINYFNQDTYRDRDPKSLYILQYNQKGELFPEQAANFGFSYYYAPLSLTISLNNRWVDSRPASTLNVLSAKGFYELEEYLDGALTISTSAFSLVGGKLSQLRLQIRDIYDTNYADAGFGGIEFPSLGRRFTLTLEQSF